MIYNNRSGRRPNPKRWSKDLPLNKMDNEAYARKNNPKIVRTIKYGKEKNKLFINCKIMRTLTKFVAFSQKPIIM